jgi:hypothetical protein
VRDLAGHCVTFRRKGAVLDAENYQTFSSRSGRISDFQYCNVHILLTSCISSGRSMRGLNSTSAGSVPGNFQQVAEVLRLRARELRTVNAFPEIHQIVPLSTGIARRSWPSGSEYGLPIPEPGTGAGKQTPDSRDTYAVIPEFLHLLQLSETYSGFVPIERLPSLQPGGPTECCRQY